MEKFVEQALLYDFYGEMLTSRQKEIYEDFVLNDLSLGEIAQEREISRQGVYDIIKRCNRQLAGYEEKLHLARKFLDTKKKVEDIHRSAQAILDIRDDQTKVMEHIAQIERMSNEILEEM